MDTNQKVRKARVTDGDEDDHGFTDGTLVRVLTDEVEYGYNGGTQWVLATTREDLDFIPGATTTSDGDWEYGVTAWAQPKNLEFLPEGDA